MCKLMELFRRMIFGTSDDQRPPIIPMIKNEVGATQQMVLYGYANNIPSNYAFIDLREAVSEDGGTIKGAEIYMNSNYLETIYFTGPSTQYYTKLTYVGSNTFSARVFDDQGQFSPISNLIVYTVRPWIEITEHTWSEVSGVGITSKDIYLNIWEFRELYNRNQMMVGGNNYMNLFIDFELIMNPGTIIPPDAVFSTTIHANKQTPTTLTFDAANNWGGATPKETLDIGKINPNELQKWATSGVLGFKLRRINASQAINMKVTFRTKDINNVEYKSSYNF